MFVVFILSLIYLSHQIYKRKGKKIYEFLKKETLEKKEIHYEHYKNEIETRFNNSK